MKTRIIDLWQKNAIGVYLFDKITEAVDEGKIAVVNVDGSIAFISADAKPSTPSYNNPVQLTPTIELPIPVVEEIVRWYQKSYPTRHSDDAIRDARATRDRLLTLVETSVLRTAIGDVPTTQGDELIKRHAKELRK